MIKTKTKLFKSNVPVSTTNLTWPQAKVRFPNLKPYGDADKDGVKNYKDCRPFDRKRQGVSHNEEYDYGFQFAYSKDKKKKKEALTAEELIKELD